MTTLRTLLFVAVLLGLVGSMGYLVYGRAVAALRLRRAGRKGLAAVLVAGLAAMVLGRVLRPVLPDAAAWWLATLGATVGLAVILSFALLLPERLFTAVRWLVTRLRRPRAESIEDSATLAGPPAGLTTRREVVGRLAAGAALSVGTGSAVYGAVFGRHDYVIEEVPIAIAGLPRTLDGFTIVQLSDVHLGMFVGERELRSMMALVARARPDLVVLTGDLIDHDVRYAEQLGEMARRLGGHAPVVAVPGNHDYYAGIDASLRSLQRAGAEVLVNRGRVIGDAGGRIALLGVDDVWARRFGPHRGPHLAQALATVPPDLPRVLLCHNPSYFPEAAGQVDLQLSGHTHGGQVNLGLRPADLVLPHGYVAGRYERGRGQLWVNRGFGTAGPPARVDAAPEVTRVVLVAG